MPKLVIEEAHALPASEAKKRVEGLGKLLADKFAFILSWRSDNEAKVERTGAFGTIRIEAARFLVSLDLSFALGPIKQRIEGWIREGLRTPAPPDAGPDARPPVDAFLTEIADVCRRHGLSIGHEDTGGGFLVSPFHEATMEWFMAASYEDRSRLDRRREMKK